jgi:hypothetical protein
MKQSLRQQETQKTFSFISLERIEYCLWRSTVLSKVIKNLLICGNGLVFLLFLSQMSKKIIIAIDVKMFGLENLPIKFFVLNFVTPEEVKLGGK